MDEAQAELEGIEPQLTTWERHVAQVILDIPHGRLATYGEIARIVAERYPEDHHSAIASRSVGIFRDKLYDWQSRETAIPLHRIASKGDLISAKDSDETRAVNNRLRAEEGTPLNDDAWWYGA